MNTLLFSTCLNICCDELDFHHNMRWGDQFSVYSLQILGGFILLMFVEILDPDLAWTASWTLTIHDVLCSLFYRKVTLCFHCEIFAQITDLPFSLYSTFVIEARHGFNKVRCPSSSFLILPEILLLIVFGVSRRRKGIFNFYYANIVFLQQTIWLFFRDMFKGILLSAIIGPPVVAAIIIIVHVSHLPLLEENNSVWKSLFYHGNDFCI